MATYSDLFNTAALGNLPANYINTTTGNAVASPEVASDTSFSADRATEAVIDDSAGTLQAILERDIPSTDVQESIATTRVSVSSSAVAGPIVRGSEINNVRAAYSAYLTGPGPALRIATVVDSSTSDTISSTSLSKNESGIWKVKLEADGSDLAATAWKKGETMPAVPQLTAQEPNLTTGRPGIAFDYRSTPVSDTRKIGYNGIGTNGDSAPATIAPPGQVIVQPTIAKGQAYAIRHRNNSQFYEGFEADTVGTEPQDFVVGQVGAGDTFVEEDPFQNFDYPQMALGQTEAEKTGSGPSFIVNYADDANFKPPESNGSGFHEVKAQIFAQSDRPLVGPVVRAGISESEWEGIFATVVYPSLAQQEVPPQIPILQIWYLTSNGLGFSPITTFSDSEYIGRHTEPYNIHMQYEKAVNNVRAKYWKKGTSEPSSFQVTVDLANVDDGMTPIDSYPAFAIAGQGVQAA